jgi:hypothetical protein
MHLVENFQRPASDDINPDALEYLFSNGKPQSQWEALAQAEQEPVARITPAYIRLQTKVEVLKGALELTGEQLHEAHHKIGMLAAELSRRDEKLKELNDYRAKAAMSVFYERQNDLMRMALEEMEKLTAAKGEPRCDVDHASIAAGYAAAVDRIDASNYKPKNVKTFCFPSLTLNTLMVLGFAAAVLATILH